MAARFPQSGTEIAWKIKDAWASKIHAIYWAATADSVHRLYPGDTETTIIPRSTSGAGFNSTNGTITGNNNTTHFTDSVSGGIGGLDEADNFGFFGAFYGNNWTGATALIIGSMPEVDVSRLGFRMRIIDFGADVQLANETAGANWATSNGGWLDDGADKLVTMACRHDQADPTNDIRAWFSVNSAAYPTKT
jgi:hypothetical protein